MHLVVRESSKRLVNPGYMRHFGYRECRARTIGGPDLIELNESIVYEGLNDLLYRLRNCEANDQPVAVLWVGSLVFGTYTLHFGA